MILVVGATGLLGSEICMRLRQSGRPVRALTRPSSNPERVQALQSAGAESLIADLKDPGSLKAACRGVSAVITTASSTFSQQAGDSIETVDYAGHLNLIEAAKEVGLRRFVYTSVPSCFRYECPLTTAKREIEAALATSGVPFTVLQANYFMEVWLAPELGFDYPNDRVTIYGRGEQALAWVSYRDVAALAVAALDHEAARNRALAVDGPENLSPHEVVGIFEEVRGRKLTVTSVAEEELRRNYCGAAAPLQKSFAALMLEYAAGCPMDRNETLHGLAHPSTSVREYASRSTAS